MLSFASGESDKPPNKFASANGSTGGAKGQRPLRRRHHLPFQPQVVELLLAEARRCR
jgi:hypothetical protein